MRAVLFRERLDSLDLVTGSLQSQTGLAPGGKFRGIPGASIDINDVMRRINQSYDAMEEAVSHPEIPKRLEICAELLDADEQWRAQLGPRRTWGAIKLALSSGTAKRKWANDMIVGTLGSAIPLRIASMEAQVEMRDELARLALALAAHCADHGGYPLALAELAPHYLPTITKDLFNGNELRYESDGGSYKLWSVGRNLTDDGGNERTDVVVQVEW